ncbi:MAG: pyridoxal-phosphate dependent enzyme [bacterium]
MNNLSSKRQALYNQILGSVKNSPIKTIEFEGNTYHFKLDYLLPYGECHYARVFSKLIYLKECLGIIKPGDILLETTSGSGGRAAAAVATALGYKIKIAIPEGGEKAREDAIIKAGAELHRTPAESYVNGFPEFIKKFLAEHPGTKYINHVMGDITGRGSSINGAAIEAFRPFIEEVIEAAIQPDVVICPLGNGTTTLPMANGFKSLFRKVKVLGFESVASGFAHRKYYQGKYERIFGINPEEVFSRQDMPGTTYAKPIFASPALDAAIPLLDGVGLVTSTYIDNLFLKTVGFIPSEKSNCIAKWDDFYPEEMAEFGRTGKAGFAIALKYVEKEKIIGKQFLIPIFDAAWHYDS